MRLMQMGMLGLGEVASWVSRMYGWHYLENFGEGTGDDQGDDRKQEVYQGVCQ